MLTVGIVTSPLVSEGKRRWKQAMEAIAQLEQNVDALLGIDNDITLNKVQHLLHLPGFQFIGVRNRKIQQDIFRPGNLLMIPALPDGRMVRHGRGRMFLPCRKIPNARKSRKKGGKSL